MCVFYSVCNLEENEEEIREEVNEMRGREREDKKMKSGKSREWNSLPLSLSLDCLSLYFLID